jgi:hypothetical protein
MTHTHTRIASLIAATALVGGVAAAPAPASVVLTPPAKAVTTGHGLSLQLWYRAYDGGARRVTVSVYRGGKRVSRRTITAPSAWRTYTLVRSPRAGTYTVTVTGGGWNARYRTRVRTAQ